MSKLLVVSRHARRCQFESCRLPLPSRQPGYRSPRIHLHADLDTLPDDVAAAFRGNAFNQMLIAQARIEAPSSVLIGGSPTLTSCHLRSVHTRSLYNGSRVVEVTHRSMLRCGPTSRIGVPPDQLTQYCACDDNEDSWGIPRMADRERRSGCGGRRRCDNLDTLAQCRS